MQFPLQTLMKAIAVGAAPLAIITQSTLRASLVVMLAFCIAELTYVLVNWIRTVRSPTPVERVDDITEILMGILSTMILGGAIGLVPIYAYCSWVGWRTNWVAAYCTGSSLFMSIGLFFPQLYQVWPRQR